MVFTLESDSCELVDSLSKYDLCASFPEYYAVQHLLFFVRETRSSWIGRFLHSRPCDWPLSTGAGWAPRFETSIVPRCKRGTFLTGTIPNGYFSEKGPLLHTPSDMTMHISFSKESFSCMIPGYVSKSASQRVPQMAYQKSRKLLT